MIGQGWATAPDYAGAELPRPVMRCAGATHRRASLDTRHSAPRQRVLMRRFGTTA